MKQQQNILALLALATLIACTKSPTISKRSSYDCEANPQECNGGIDPTDSSNLTVNVPSSTSTNTDFEISWSAYPGAETYDVAISADEQCKDKTKLEIELKNQTVLKQQFVMTKTGTFYVCLSAKNERGIILVRKTGIKLEITTGSSDPGFTAPSNLRISADSAAGSTHSSTDDDTTIYFIWDAATDATNGIKSYSLKYYAAAGCTGTLTEVTVSTGTSYTFSSANYNSTYSFIVTATNGANLTKTSSCSNSITINYPTHNITFDTPANYTYDNTLLSVSGGVATLLALNQTYDDNSSSEFGLTKAHNNTTWDTDHLELKNAGAPDPRPLPNDFYYGVDATGMVMRVPFDDPFVENGDTYYDDLGHNVAIVDVGATNGIGKHGRAYRPNNGYASISNHTDLQLQDFTILAWIKYADPDGCIIVKKDGNNVSQRNYRFDVDGSANVRLQARAGGVDNAVDVASSVTINDGAWHHVVAQVSGTNSYIFVDGVLSGSDTHTGALFTNSHSLSAAHGCTNTSFDEFAIFSRALSATEIATLYQNQIKNFTHEHWTEAPGLMDGNILLLHMDEASGNLVDYSGLGISNTASGTPSYSQTGKIGNSITFSGDDRFDFGDIHGFTGTSTFSVGGWAYITSSGVIVGRLDTGSANQGWYLWHNGANTLHFKRQNISTTTTVNTGAWHHLMGTYDGTTQRLFVDGIEVGSDANANSMTVGVDLRVGAGYNLGSPSAHFSGSLDELAIWNRALSPQEIQTIYNLQSGNYRGNVHELPNDQDQTVDAWFPMNGNVLLMHMNETSIKDSGTNPTIYDYSGNGNNGTFDANDDGNEKATGGQLTGSMNFDGVNDFVTIGNQADIQFSNTSSFTLFAWIKVDDLASERKIFRKDTWGDGGPVLRPYYNFKVNSTATLACSFGEWGGGETTANIDSDGTIPLNKWMQVACVRDVGSDNIKIFINGNLDKQATDPSTGTWTNNVGNLYIGQTGTAQETTTRFSGSIDEVAIWNRALSEDEVRKIYDHQSAKYSGTFTSDVMDTGTTGASWTTLAWNMIRPYGKELGTSSDLSSSYTALPNDTLMNGNVLLMHFNETGEDTVDGGTKDIEDFSGQNNHGTTTGSPTYKALGKFGYAMEFDGTDDCPTISDHSSLSPGTGDFSLAGWFKTGHDHSSTAAFIYTENDNTSIGYYRVTIGTDNKLSAAFQSISDSLVVSGLGPTVNDNKWHHYVWNLTSVAGRTADLYLDGAFVGSANDATPGTITVHTADPPSIGCDDTGSSAYFKGLIDEVAIWNRALSASEVSELYRRGASRVRYKVRTCDASGCDDEPWIVPDSTLTPYSSTGEFFSELHNTTTSNPSLTFGGFGSHTVGNNQFFQWKAYLDTSDTAEIPELKSVTVGPTHYPGSNPTIATSNALTFSSLISFTETSTTGTIKYQLSNDGGTTWYYYNSGWTTTTSGYTNSNTATDINTNIATFPVGSGSLQVKAFLNSSAASQATDLSGIDIQYQP